MPEHDPTRQFLDAAKHPRFRGHRVKDHRHEPIQPGGRTELTLFRTGPEGPRPHPRLQVAPLPLPEGAADLPELPAFDGVPADLAAFEGWLAYAHAAVADQLSVDQATPGAGQSPQYWALRGRAARAKAFVAQVRSRVDAWAEAGALEGELLAGARYALARLADGLREGTHAFDDVDTGTYHSYGKDAPFVHFLERMLGDLPTEGSPAMALLDGHQQAALRRQRGQAQAWLDHLMRHKYTHDGVTETDAERTLGGFLIDRASRHVLSETPESRDALAPRYELLRIDPTADHPHAGAWVFRSGEDLLLQGAAAVPAPAEDAATFVVSADPALLRRSPVETEALSLRRAPGHRALRAGMRLDWDGSGVVDRSPIAWVSWAGHCDIKAVLEALGICLREDPPPQVMEWRADTGQTSTFDRDLLLEMVAAVCELGSVYQRLDGSGKLMRGGHQFGGARNDSRPDRLQLQGLSKGRGFRWPLGGRKDAWTVTGLSLPEGEAGPQEVRLETAFLRSIPTEDQRDFAPNPRFEGTVEGDYNIIDVSDGLLEVDVREDRYDPATGYPSQEQIRVHIDLSNTAGERSYLGTAPKDPADRSLYKVYVDRQRGGVVGEVERWAANADGIFEPTLVPEEEIFLPMAQPFVATLSREMKRDAPEAFGEMLGLALDQALNICADTDMEAEVWNGVVTRMQVEREDEDPKTRVERWKVDIKARFGEASLRYLLRRDPDGVPSAWCPLEGAEGEPAPDFLWRETPDIASKGHEAGAWLVNEKMRERQIVGTEWSSAAPGGVYVHDEQIKNVFELLWVGLSGRGHTILLNNKRYFYERAEDWQADIALLAGLRDAVLDPSPAA